MNEWDWDSGAERNRAKKPFRTVNSIWLTEMAKHKNPIDFALYRDRLATFPINAIKY